MKTERNMPAGIRCPTCQVPLIMSERQDIEIDYSPTCRDVWLDRGEFDKIIERSTSGEAELVRRSGSRHDDGHEYRSHHGTNTDYGHRGSRHKSWLSEIFD